MYKTCCVNNIRLEMQLRVDHPRTPASSCKAFQILFSFDPTHSVTHAHMQCETLTYIALYIELQPLKVARNIEHGQDEHTNIFILMVSICVMSPLSTHKICILRRHNNRKLMAAQLFSPCRSSQVVVSSPLPGRVLYARHRPTPFWTTYTAS